MSFWKPGLTQENRYTQDLDNQISTVKSEVTKLETNQVVSTNQYQFTTEYIKRIEGRIRFLKSPSNKLVSMAEFKELRRCLEIANRNEDALRQNLEFIEVNIEHCKKDIARLEALREASSFKLLEFKRSVV